MITHYIREENCCYCLQAFRTAETLKCHIKDSFKINHKKKVKMPKNSEYVRFKNKERKLE